MNVIFLTDRDWIASTRRAESYMLGSLPEATNAWLERLEEIGSRGEGVLIAGSDRATELVINERVRIPGHLRSFEGPESAHLKLMDKGSLYEIADRAGVRYPWTLRLSSRNDLGEVAELASYPCVIKPSLSHLWRRLFGNRRVLPVRDPDELARLAGPALDAGLELLVTEEIPGPDRSIEGAVTIRREDGTYALRYGRRKIRQYPPGFGAGSLFEAAEDPDTVALTDRLLNVAGFVGISVVEAKRHEETGEMVLIEVNVRVPQSFAVGDAAGTDASWRLYAELAGIPLAPQPAPSEGVRVIVPSLEPRAAISNVQERRTTLRALLASYRGVRDLSGLSVRDPGPLTRLATLQLRTLFRLLRRRPTPAETIE